MEYIVARSETYWFKTKVEAESLEEALSKAKHPSNTQWVKTARPDANREWKVTTVEEDN